MRARAFLTMFLLVLGTGSVWAQQLTVRSGEHGEFSRLVIPFPQGTRWTVSQDAAGVTLAPGGGAFRYDLTEVFRFIPKSRITAIRSQVGTSDLVVETTGVVHTKTFQLANGAVVLDIVDGPAEDGPGLATKFGAHPGAPVMPHLETYWADKAAAETATNGTPAPRAPVALTAPDPRVADAERKLLENLSRATAQGIFNVDMTRKSAGRSDGLEEPYQTAQNPPGGAGDEELAIRSQTVMDRDMDISGDETRILLTGQRCMPDRLFDLQSWRSEAPVPDQIAAARAALVGEFDRPDPGAALNLVRLYLSLGFGAEAKDALRSFGGTSPPAATYHYIADILNGAEPAQDSPIIGMAGCNGKVSLWAMLGANTLPQVDQVDLQAVQAAFSGLPPDVRNIVGPDLVDRLLAIGARDTAQAVLNALDRSPDPRGAAQAITRARIAMSQGDTETVERRVMPIARSNDGAAAQALILAIDARLERNRPVDRESVENAAALAQELGATRDGLLLRRATALGEGSTGAFDAAFAALDNWPQGALTDLQFAARQELYAQLAKVPDDKIFLGQVLRRVKDAAQSGLPSELQIALSERLIAEGFSREAKSIIDDATKNTPDGRIALARAALNESDSAAAISHLEGLDGEQAQRLKAEALARLGEHDVAARIFAANGDTSSAGQEAWRAGDWSLVEQYGEEVQKQAVRVLTYATPAPDGAEQTGLITRSNGLIEDSKKERRLFEVLLSQ